MIFFGNLEEMEREKKRSILIYGCSASEYDEGRLEQLGIWLMKSVKWVEVSWCVSGLKEL